MAQDDMHVLMYKALAYLYSCMKSGACPDRAMLQSSGPLFGGVPERYWAAIWAQMVDRGLVRGVGIQWYDDARHVVIQDAEITLEGVEFMHENSMMHKAKEFLRDAKIVLPFV